MYVITLLTQHIDKKQILYYRGHDAMTSSDYWTGKLENAVKYDRRKDANEDVSRLWGDNIKVVKLSED